MRIGTRRGIAFVWAATTVALHAQTHTLVTSLSNLAGSGTPPPLVLAADGNFYGTVAEGSGKGSVFRITPSGNVTTVYSFGNAANEGEPFALVRGRNDHLYGMTRAANGSATFFELTTSGTLTTLRSFASQDQYDAPWLTLGNDGNFYGPYSFCFPPRTCGGAIIKFTTSGTPSMLHEFNIQSEGAFPYAPLLAASDGNLYGCTTAPSPGQSIIYKVTTAGVLTVLHRFSLTEKAFYNPLVEGVDGNLYGTLVAGGRNFIGQFFKITPSGQFTALWDFGSDATVPATSSRMIRGSGADFYGVSGGGGANGKGTIFKITKDGVITTLHSFTGSDGTGAAASLVLGQDGLVYGITNGGGTFGRGTFFRLGGSSTATPVISSGGIRPVFSPAGTIQAGEWVSIYGTNLADGTYTWKGDFPTLLGGVSVRINGKLAYLWYVSPTQINLQAPDDSATGTVPVVVTSSTGSASSTVNLGSYAPSFNLLDRSHVAGLILRFDGSGAYGGGTYDIIGPTGTTLGYATVAAKAGDIVELFGVGFGPTNPPIPAGLPFTGAAPTASPVVFTIGGTTVVPSFAGLTGAGLFQFNLTIPPGLGTGDVALSATAGGATTPIGAVIAIQ